MKKVLVIINTLLFVTITLKAQIQHGYVKTKGRLASNGTVISGTRISGATVQIKGRSAVLSQSNGTFSFPIPSQSFYLQSVQKQGYILTDPEALSHKYNYSSNPLILVLETPDQQADDKLISERKIRRTLQRRLQQKENEIEELKLQRKLTEDEYREQMQELYARQESDEKLISQMAERYSQIDYDQLDDFNRQVSIFILNGELQKADSLLNTKGDIISDISEYHRLQDVNAKEKEELAQRKENLDKNIAYENWKKEDLAQRCYGKFEIFKMQHQNDSAAHYLELRASLDSTDVHRLSETGLLMEELFYYDQAEYYAQKTINIVIDNDQLPDKAAYHYNLASVLCRKGDFENSIKEYKIALNMWESEEGENSADVARCYNDIGYAYYAFDEKNNDSFSYYEKALKIRRNVFGEIHREIAMTLNNMGLWYYSHNNLDSAIVYIKKALDINTSLSGDTHPDIATRYNNIGMIYDKKGDSAKAIDYYLRATAVLQKLYGERSPNIANTYSNLGLAYHNSGNYYEAIKYKELALELMKFFLGDYHPNIAWTTNDVGYIYFDLKKYDEAISYFSKAISIGNAVWKDECPFALSSIRMINISKYYKAIEERNLSTFLQKYVFIANMVDGETPAKKLGLSGEYVLLELEDWSQYSLSSLFDKNAELQGKPKTIVVMKNGEITQYHFMNTIGAEFGIKEISAEERLHINQIYDNWKKQQSEQ